MIEPNGKLIATRHVNTVRNILERIDYEWQGGPVARVSGDLARELEYKPDSDVIRIGPYRLQVLERLYMYDAYLCVRKDWPFWWLIALRHRLDRRAEITYRRLIVTLAVWGLADWPYGGAMLPSWRDIYAVKWITRKLHREKKA